MTSNPDQARAREYLVGALECIKKKTKSISSKNGNEWRGALIALFDTTLRVVQNKLPLLSKADIISSSKLQKILVGFKESLLAYMGANLKKLEKRASKHESSSSRSLTLLCTLEALLRLGVTPSELAPFKSSASAIVSYEKFMADDMFEIGKRLQTFMAAYSEHENNPIITPITGDTSTAYGRQSILERTRAAVAGKEQTHKFNILTSLLASDPEDLGRLDKLLAAREVIMSCDGKRPNPRTQ